MTYIDVALLIIAFISYFQFHEHNRNNVRHDERKYGIILAIAIALLFLSLTFFHDR